MATQFPLRNGGLLHSAALTVDDTSYAWTYNLASGADWVLQEDSTEVGRYDGGDGAWYFYGSIDGQAVEITQSLDDTSADGLDVTLTSSAPGNAAWWLRCYYDARVSFAGGLRFSGGGSFGIYTTSDASLKQQIRPLDPSEALARVQALRVRRYRRIGAQRDEIGLVLQEVREDWPELAETPEQVATESERERQRAAARVARCAARLEALDAAPAADRAERRKLDEQRAAVVAQMQAAQRIADAPDRPGCIVTHEVPYALVGAVQALAARVEALEARLAALEGR